MSVFKYLSLLSILLILSSSCVTKKKYLEMESSKNKFQAESKKLKSQNKDLQTSLKVSESDFKSMKDFFAASDAIKNDELEKIQLDLSKIEESYNVIKEDLNKTKDLFTDQRYVSAKSSSDIARLEMEVKQLSRDTVSLNYSMKLARQRVDEYKKRNSEQTDKLMEKATEHKELSKKLLNKEGEITKLQAQVAGEQKKLLSINKAFVELRKELLRNKGKGVALDPNNDANIDKISSVLFNE